MGNNKFKVCAYPGCEKEVMRNNHNFFGKTLEIPHSGRARFCFAHRSRPNPGKAKTPWRQLRGEAFIRAWDAVWELKPIVLKEE